MAIHAMIDKETLGTNPDTVILTIGVVLFDPCATGIIDRIELRPTIEDQTDVYNRTINDSTVEWWSKQSAEAIEEAMGDRDRISFRECMESLQQFCWKAEKVWSNGSVFDIIVAESAFRDLGIDPPWKFWEIRDCRTIYDLAGVSLKDSKYQTKTTHKAVEDAEHQAIVVQDAYKKLIKAGFTHIR